MTNTVSLKSIYLDFKAITKAGLAISVVFSSIAGFVLGIDYFEASTWWVLLKLAIGGYCMVGASNAYNQVIEKDLDAIDWPEDFLKSQGNVIRSIKGINKFGLGILKNHDKLEE